MIGTLTLSLLANELAGRLIGSDVEFSEVSTDTRTLSDGAVYLALKGERFNGNEFIRQARERGACGAIVSEGVSDEIAADLSLLQVADTHEALAEIARINRERGNARVIALTGSQGKTTVKEMLGSILRRSAPTLITAANLNNTIGVSLTLLQLNEQHAYAVVEMGADTAGEIAFSSRTAQADIAVITNASAAHIEGFGSLQGIVSAKGEIIDELSEDGILLLNADDQHAGVWAERAGHRRTIFFACERSESTDYYAADIQLENEGRVSFKMVSPVGEQDISMQLLGKHNVTNALAAAGAAIEAGASLHDVAAGLAELQPIQGRLLPLQGLNGCRLIDDSYNASPSSFFAAIDVLMSFTGKKYVLAGDMKELGSDSDAAHKAVGAYAAKAGVDELWAVGEQSRLTVEAFAGKARHFEEKSQLLRACEAVANKEAVFLIKGSRGARMDTLVNDLNLGEDI